MGSSSLLFEQDDKWVERHTLSSSRQRWTLGRAVGEVDFVMNHPSISRRNRENSGRAVSRAAKKVPLDLALWIQSLKMPWISMFTSLACTSCY